MLRLNGTRSGNDRRSDDDRRLTSLANLNNTYFFERRNAKARRALVNRREGFVPVNRWPIVFLAWLLKIKYRKYCNFVYLNSQTVMFCKNYFVETIDQ